MTIVSTRSFYVDQVRDVTVVCFTVSTMMESNFEFVSDELFEFVEHVTSNGPSQIVLDLSSVRKIDDWGMAMLRAFHETIRIRNGTTIFCRIWQSVQETMTKTGLTEEMTMCDTRSQAIRSFSDLMCEDYQ